MPLSELALSSIMKSDGKGEKFAINDIICNFVSNDYQKSVCNTFIYKIIDPLWNLGTLQHGYRQLP